jgi:N-acetylglucosamine-6-phosphate deacetylase
MEQIAIRAKRLFTPLEEIADGMVVVEEGRIVAAGRREEFELRPGTREYDARRWTLSPGFVDIHIHGAGGHDVMEGDAAAIGHVARTIARYGTTSFVATTVTASPDDLCRSLEGIARVAGTGTQGDDSAPAAELLGIHFEGPFLSPARRGVHPPKWLAEAKPELLVRLIEAAGGAARILTMAPELPGGLALVDRGVEAGLLVAMGHTNATYEEAVAAIEHGVRHGVHVFNAMRPFSHRDTGVIGAVLTRPEVTAEVIADGVHVHAPAIQLLVAAKGTEQVILVTDATAATAMPDGRYRLGTFEVNVSGGVCRDAEGRLAGSTLTLDRAVRQMVELGVSTSAALRMATYNPARRIGIERRKGVIAPGADADLVLLDDGLHVAGVMTRRMREPAVLA